MPGLYSFYKKGERPLHIHTWQIRESRGLTLVEMENLTGISKTTLNDIENGKVSPTLDTLEKIASGLGIKITDLFTSEYK